MKESQDHDITSPDAEPDFAGRAGRQDRVDMNHKGIIAVACILIVAILWCLEPWQRPGMSKRVPDWVLLMLVSFGVLCGALRLGFVRKSEARWRRAFAFCVCGFVLLAGMRLLCGKLTLYHLESRIDQQISNPGPSLEEPRKPISARLVGTLEWLRLGVPNWLAEHAARPNPARSRSLPEILIASSRWPLRRAAADAILRNHKRSKFLMQHWKDYFPAIIGADVGMEHRRDWMWRLNALREDDSLTSTPRQAAVFCMALVILTDPPELEEWRIPVRDAMLGWRKPLAPSIIDEWMRTIDTLLALDPPELWVGLTAPLTTNHDQFRYAMRVPVRGLAGNFDALMREFELMESRNQTEHGFALWQGAGQSLAYWPDQFGKSETAKIQDWRRDILFRWLMDHSRGTRQELAKTRGRVLLEVTPGQQEQLSASATEWARLACDEMASAAGFTKLTDSRPFKIVCLLYPYLEEHQQPEVSRLLIPLMLRPDLFHKSGPLKSVRFDPDWTELLWKVRPLMNDDERRALQQALTPLMADLFVGDHSSALLLCMDAWSDIPVLTPEKWLALAWHVRRGWRIVPQDTPINFLDTFKDGALPVPQVADSPVESLGRILDDAWAQGTKGFASKLHQSMNGVNSTAPYPKIAYHFAERRLRSWQSSGLLGSHPAAELLKMELYLRGLRRLDENQLIALQRIAENRQETFSSDFGAELYRTENPANPWKEILQNPQTAAHEAVRWIGHKQESWALYDLMFWLEKSPPDAAVCRAIWDALRKQSLQTGGESKTRIFGMLFRLSPMLPHDECLAMRRDFLETYKTEGFHLVDFNDGEEWGMPWLPLDYLGGGMGIPWEEDELSSSLSWSSNFGRLTSLNPEETMHLHPRSAFRFLALGVFPRFERINPVNSVFKRREIQPLAPPFEATPWQRARELHLRRPDLDVR